MSEMTLTIRDAQWAIHGHVHGSVVERAIAALASDPATIEELVKTMGRYANQTEFSNPFAHFRQGVSNEPFDAGVAVIDLEARLVSCESTYSRPGHDGSVRYHDGHQALSIEIPYNISADWLFVDHLDGWEVIAAERRLHWSELPRPNHRTTLYEEIIPFLISRIVEKIAALKENSGHKQTSRQKENSGHKQDFGDKQNIDRAKRLAIRDIHSEWLLTTREDLNHNSPRQILLAQLEHVEQDIENQSIRWSSVGQPPPSVSRDSWAYQHGGYGLHEFVVYYHLTRQLLCECWDRVWNCKSASNEPAEIEHLRQHKQEWLHAPSDDFSGMSPAQVVDRERSRLPWVYSHADMADCDCPLCASMAEGNFGPSFCFLDTSDFDTDFAFSRYENEEEWELEMGDHHRWCQENDEEPIGRVAPLFITSVVANSNDLSTPRWNAPVVAKGGDEPLTRTSQQLDSSMWECSFTSPKTFELGSDMAIPVIQIFAIGAHVAELVQNLRDRQADGEVCKRLLSSFADVRQAIRDESGQSLESRVDAMTEILDSIGSEHLDLRRKCDGVGEEVGILQQTVQMRASGLG